MYRKTADKMDTATMSERQRMSMEEGAVDVDEDE